MIFIIKTAMKLKKRYYLPTPKFWRRVGDGLLGVSTMITSASIFGDYKWLALASLLIGVIGKFLTNLFAVPSSDEYDDPVA